jgi:ABC-type dipeptide/oligopeptide/nickel transport system permease subunit
MPHGEAPALAARPARRLRLPPPPVLFWGALVLLILLSLTGAPWLAPFDPARQNLLQRFAAPSALHWLGTDHLGRDVLSRTLYGGRFSVSITAITLGLSVLVGVLLGVISARAGGWIDELIMRLVDLLISFPDVLVALFLVALLGPGYGTLILALTLHSWTPFARMMRGLTLELNRRDYIRAAEILNCSRRFIVLRHMIPNAMRPVAAIALLRFGHKLIVVGGLSFLGLGVQPPMSDWGSMLAESRRYMDRAPMLVIAPGLAIFLTALAVSSLGQAMDTAAAPRRRWLRLPWRRAARAAP